MLPDPGMDPGRGPFQRPYSNAFALKKVLLPLDCPRSHDTIFKTAIRTETAT